MGQGKGGVKRVVVAEIAIAGKPAPTIDVGCIQGRVLGRKNDFLRQLRIQLQKLLAVRATIAHYLIVKNMTLALRIFIFHLHRYNFADFWNAAHGQDFGHIQVRAIGVVLDNRGVLAGQFSRGFVRQGSGGAQAAQGDH